MSEVNRVYIKNILVGVRRNNYCHIGGKGRTRSHHQGLSSDPYDSGGVTRASGAGAVGASGDGCEVTARSGT